MTTNTTTPPLPPQPAALNPLQCQICDRQLSAARRLKPLYGVGVCIRCRNAFANRRQLAFIVDWFVSSAAVGLCSGVLFALLEIVSRGAADNVAALDGRLVSWSETLVWGCLIVCKDGFAGISPGKALCGVRVVDAATREPIGFGQSIKRNLCLLIPFVPLFMAFMLIKGRRWGDRWANTEVIWRKHAHKFPFDRRGRYCAHCGYDLTGNVSGRCSECDTPVPQISASAPSIPNAPPTAP